MSVAPIGQLRLPPGVRLDSSEAIMIASDDAQRRVLFVNAAFARMTGFEARAWDWAESRPSLGAQSRSSEA